MTDMELLALPKIGPEAAARYLQNGTNAQEIRVKAQLGKCPFCIGSLIKYKAGELR